MIQWSREINQPSNINAFRASRRTARKKYGRIRTRTSLRPVSSIATVIQFPPASSQPARDLRMGICLTRGPGSLFLFTSYNSAVHLFPSIIPRFFSSLLHYFLAWFVCLRLGRRRSFPSGSKDAVTGETWKDEKPRSRGCFNIRARIKGSIDWTSPRSTTFNPRERTAWPGLSCSTIIPVPFVSSSMSLTCLLAPRVLSRCFIYIGVYTPFLYVHFLCFELPIISCPNETVLGGPRKAYPEICLSTPSSNDENRTVTHRVPLPHGTPFIR